MFKKEKFKKQKENRIKELENKDVEYYDAEYDAVEASLPEEITASDYINYQIKKRDNEIKQLKQELADNEYI